MSKDNYNFSVVLKSCFDARVKRNPSYSLRAFARDVSVSPSHLSELLNGRASPSRTSIRTISAAIGLAPDRIEKICDTYDATNSKIEWRRKMASRRLKESHKDKSLYMYSDDEAKYISGIIHPTILAYLELTNPPQTPEELALRTGKPVKTIVAALARLERIGAIEYLDDGGIKVTRTRTRVNEGVSPDAIRTFHGQFSDFLLRAMVEQPRSTRHYDAIVYAMSSEAIDDFKSILTETRKKLTEVSERYSKKDVVCYVNFQMAEGRTLCDN